MTLMMNRNTLKSKSDCLQFSWLSARKTIRVRNWYKCAIYIVTLKRGEIGHLIFFTPLFVCNIKAFLYVTDPQKKPVFDEHSISQRLLFYNVFKPRTFIYHDDGL